ncbi:RNA-directed DNA polymerase, eukaryota, reverse transcriptase zinc-binding domain protein [Tanacetum coccineum]|uniref:RNA-directed DNA polymerase, eukaryota, reverse transcriptase zinc-binding domain protein n=1 Tax=Tanacetum coccineum TaxID=301880 RepID=A0ABQ5EW72_9ASTR
MSICNDNGVRFEGNLVADQFVQHFQKFLGPNENGTELQTVNLFSNKLLEEEALIMVSEVHDKEIKDAMFDIGENRAPGPDGFTSAFYKHSWSIVGKDICQAIREFFNTGKLLGELNATLITLIPKINNPIKVSDYRPIACCNVLYKCISKIITNRIKSGLDKLVNVNQSAFVPGRVIQDNLMITQELLKGYNCKNGPSRCSFKIDIAKAYDTVDWNFLRKILINFGFHEKMVGWIMSCVSTAAFTIGINGERYGYFRSGRGLRQGDPVSPYLFTLIMEVFSLMLARKVKECKKFKFHKGCKEMQLTHLSFADDLLVLCHGDEVSVNVIKDALLEFSNCSGLKPNMEKSVVFFGSVKEITKQKIIEILPFKVGKLPVRYLGIPLLAKKLSIKDCNQLVEKVKSKIQDWKNRFLSYAGKLQLIAAVLSTMQTYWAAVLKIPKTVVKEIDSILKKFLWGNGVKGRSKVSWNDVCKSKKEGGLGIKNLGDWNEVNLVKLKGKSFWVIEEEPGDSGTWKALLDLKRKKFSLILFTKLGMVREFLYLIENGKWSWPESWSMRFNQIRHLQVPDINNNKEDQVKWRKRNGQIVDFSIRDVWWDLKCVHPCVPWYKAIWFPQCNPSRCNDSHDHLFFRCDFSAKIWDVLKYKMNMVPIPDNYTSDGREDNARMNGDVDAYNIKVGRVRFAIRVDFDRLNENASNILESSG